MSFSNYTHISCVKLSTTVIFSIMYLFNIRLHVDVTTLYAKFAIRAIADTYKKKKKFTNVVT